MMCHTAQRQVTIDVQSLNITSAVSTEESQKAWQLGNAKLSVSCPHLCVLLQVCVDFDIEKKT